MHLREIRLTLFLLISLIVIRLLLIFFTHTLISEEMLYQELIEHLDQQQVLDLLQKRYEHINYSGYVISALAVGIRIFLVFMCIVIGVYVFSLEFKSYQVLNAIILAEFIFILPGVIKLFWFVFIQTEYGIKDLQSFSGFSVLSFFNQEIFDNWLIYPLRSLNLFEALYWLVLAYQLSKIINKSFNSSLKFVAATYGVGLFIWQLFAMFVILSIT